MGLDVLSLPAAVQPSDVRQLPSIGAKVCANMQTSVVTESEGDLGMQLLPKYCLASAIW